jgi:hypothetical protein
MRLRVFVTRFGVCRLPSPGISRTPKSTFTPMDRYLHLEQSEVQQDVQELGEQMVEKANDIVERLRKEANGVTVNLTNPWPTMREAADEIALCRAQVTELEDRRLRALLAATVGNLTVIGYQNALAQVRAALSGT